MTTKYILERPRVHFVENLLEKPPERPKFRKEALTSAFYKGPQGLAFNLIRTLALFDGDEGRLRRKVNEGCLVG